MPEQPAMIPFAIALDLGSTSIKAGLLDGDGLIKNVVARPVPPMQVSGDRYESDALAYVETAEAALKACLEQVPKHAIPLGICTQRSSFLLWERSSGKPVTSLISWQDARGAASCEALQSSEAEISRLSGLRLTAYYLAPKLRVLLLQNPGWREKLLSREWLVGTLDTFLIWRWSDGGQYIMDTSMAARTLLLDIHRQQWSAHLCELFGVPQAIFPQVTASTGLKVQLNNGLILQAMLADQSAALFAAVGRGSDVALVNLGTGGFVIRMLETGKSVSPGYLRTLVYQTRNENPQFAAEGTLNSIASALAPYPVAQCRENQLGQQPDIFCIAEPSGIGAPYFRKDIGLSFSRPVANLSAIEMAVLLQEAIIFRVARIVEEFQCDAPLRRIYLAGGLSELPCIRQGLAVCLNLPLAVLQQHEASLQGAALLAATHIQAEMTVQAEEIPVFPNHLLQDKYQRWKVWLDEVSK